MSGKWLEREKTKNWEICQLAIYILQNKKVANLSAKKHALSCCGSPIKMMFLVAAKENV